jgi:phosphodiesterase/alkaline phosphatase D-like protein
VADTLEGYFGRYRDTFGDAHLQAALAAIPGVLMWDDHEISNDWYPGKNARYPNARAAFDRYQGLLDPAPITAGALYFSFRAGGADVFVLDCRSHRSPNTQTDGSAKTMLGAAQRDALLAWLDASDAPFKVIASSVPFNRFSTTADDSWLGRGNTTGAFQTERDLILSHIVTRRIGGVILLSGDQHWAGAFKIPAPTGAHVFHELMPTPAAVSNRTAPGVTSDEILYMNDQRLVFGLFTFDTTVTPAVVTVRFIDPSGQVRYTLSLDESDLAP